MNFAGTAISWIYWVLMAAYGITILSVIAVILSENRNPVKSLAWVTVLLLLPAVGLLCYIFFGRNIKNKHMISRRNKRRLKRRRTYRNRPTNLRRIAPEHRRIARLAHSLDGGAIYCPDNRVEIFDGAAKFESMLADIRSAKKFINLQYYIFENDNIGRRVKDALIERARSGVKVRVIYDHVGCIRVKRRFFAEMREAGIDVHPFFRVAVPWAGSRANWRNHRKIVIIDGRTGYIGGMNIADRYVDGGPKFESWRDTHLRVTGPIVKSLQYSFSIDWKFMGQPLPDEEFSSAPDPSRGLEADAQLLTGGPMSRWHNIADVYLRAIAAATERVYIQTPYFLPTESLLKALQSTALAGIDVRIMIPRRGDSRLLSYASGSYIRECIQSGIKFYFYDTGMLHSKVMIVDNDFASVGSTNFDFRSFEHNFEGNLLLYSRAINDRLRELFISDQHRSSRVNAADWRRRPFTVKAIESIVRLLSPIL